MRTFVLPEVPDPDIPTSITTDKFALVGMDDDVVHRKAGMRVIPLYRRRAGIPDLDRPILGACHQPFPLAMPTDARHIPAMTLKGQDRVRIGILNVKELYRVSARRCQETLVR